MNRLVTIYLQFFFSISATYTRLSAYINNLLPHYMSNNL